MRNRLERGKLHKAERGRVDPHVPCGYVKLPTGEVAFDPDEQARSTVQLVFDKFDELGSFGRLYRSSGQNKIRLGMRLPPRTAARRVGMAAAHAGDAAPDAPPPDLRGGLFLRTSPRRSQADGRERRQGQDATRCRCRSGRCCNGIVCRPTSRGSVTWRISSGCSEPPAARFARGAPRRHGAADGPAGLRGMWPTDVRRLPEQVDRLLRVYAAEDEGSTCCGLEAAAIDDLVAQQVLRPWSRRPWN